MAFHEVPYQVLKPHRQSVGDDFSHHFCKHSLSAGGRGFTLHLAATVASGGVFLGLQGRAGHYDCAWCSPTTGRVVKTGSVVA